MSVFDKAVEFILPHETEYTRGHWGQDAYVVTENVEGDSGGRTRYGIDQKSHPNVDVASLTRDGAIAIYRQEWQRHNLSNLPDKIAIIMFDVFVNGGYAVLWLQRAINYVCHPRPLLAEDGNIGVATISATWSCDQQKVVDYFINERDMRFMELARNPERQKFLNGWLKRDNDLRDFLK